MDISNLQPNDTVTLSDFKDNNGNLMIDERTGEPVTITIWGRHTEAFSKAVAQRAREKIAAGETNVAEIPDNFMILEVEREARDVAAMTVGWTGLYDGGKPYKFSQKNAVKLYIFSEYLRDRVDRAIKDKELFLKKPKSS